MYDKNVFRRIPAQRRDSDFLLALTHGTNTNEKRRQADVGNKPKLSDLTFFASQVNSAIARGQGKTISFEDIHDNLEEGDIVEWLNKRIPFPGGVDLGPLIELKRGAAINHVLHEVAGGLYGRERRKLARD